MGAFAEFVTFRHIVHSSQKYLSFLLLCLIAAGCTTPNAPYRTADPVHCTTIDCSECTAADCSATFIEHHNGFDLAYVEFTERGNVFDRKRMKRVLDHVGKHAQYDPKKPEQGVMTVVFVHGWKHNAHADDQNVDEFRKMLFKASLTKKSPRKLIGVYIGWRGLSIDWGFLANLSYWDRKAVAQQVAKGGVTELLVRLEREVIDDARPNRNLYLVTGHSFGGAVVLSALNEILLERVAEASAGSSGDDCIETRPFGHGVVLLNPAIEANEALQLKELVAETCFVDTQDRLMHVISSDADAATNDSFVLGQRLGANLSWRQAELKREFDGEEISLYESELDTTTVGNFTPFQTGQLNAVRANDTDEADDTDDTKWDYQSCVGGTKDCIDGADGVPHIPAKQNDPLAFIQTDGTFITDHNDVFNDNVSAYLAAIVAEARYKRSGAANDDLPKECLGGEFGPCFAVYQNRFESIKLEEPGDGTQ